MKKLLSCSRLFKTSLRSHLMHQFTQISNQAVIPGPKPNKYEMKFEVKKQYTASVGDIDVLVEVCSFVFNFTEIGIEKIEDNKVIFKLIMIGYMVNHLNQHMLVLFRSNSFQSLIQLIILVLE